MIKKIMIFLIGIMFFLYSFVNVEALSVKVPPTDGNEDIIINNSDNISGDGVGGFWKNIFVKINDYLWIFMVIVSGIFLIRGGIRLIISQGSDEEFNKTNNIIIFSLVGIGVSIGSYLIIRLITNLL